jgi:hypothetical protein
MDVDGDVKVDVDVDVEMDTHTSEDTDTDMDRTWSRECLKENCFYTDTGLPRYWISLISE